MNEEKYVLARIKRWIGTSIEADLTEKGYVRDIDKRMILAKIMQFEADAVLGEETDEGLPFNDEEVE